MGKHSLASGPERKAQWAAQQEASRAERERRRILAAFDSGMSLGRVAVSAGTIGRAMLAPATDEEPGDA